jgi:hypothetical protein
MVSIRLNDAKMNMILTFPSSLWSLTIDINQGEEVWGVPRSSGRRDPPRNCGSHPVKHQEVSFGGDIMQRTQILTFPLSLVLNIIDIGWGRSGEALEARGEEIQRRRMLRMSLPIGRGGSCDCYEKIYF